jgi:hypothetical protein
MSNSSIERRIATYPKPKYYALVIMDSRDNAVSTSSMVSKIIERHYDNMPNEERLKLLHKFNQLDSDEIKKKK